MPAGRAGVDQAEHDPAYDFLRAGERFVSGGILLPASYQPGNVRLVNTGPFVRLEVRY